MQMDFINYRMLGAVVLKQMDYIFKIVAVCIFQMVLSCIVLLVKLVQLVQLEQLDQLVPLVQEAKMEPHPQLVQLVQLVQQEQLGHRGIQGLQVRREIWERLERQGIQVPQGLLAKRAILVQLVQLVRLD